jgi:hypothetical protein
MLKSMNLTLEGSGAITAEQLLQKRLDAEASLKKWQEELNVRDFQGGKSFADKRLAKAGFELGCEKSANNSYCRMKHLALLEASSFASSSLNGDLAFEASHPAFAGLVPREEYAPPVTVKIFSEAFG